MNYFVQWRSRCPCRRGFVNSPLMTNKSKHFISMKITLTYCFKKGSPASTLQCRKVLLVDLVVYLGIYLNLLQRFTVFQQEAGRRKHEYTCSCGLLRLRERRFGNGKTLPLATIFIGIVAYNFTPYLKDNLSRNNYVTFYILRFQRKLNSKS